MVNEYYDYYDGKNIMITGGLGFIGSTLARRIVDMKRHGINIGNITLVDALIPGLGGKKQNISGIESGINLHEMDISDKKINSLLPGIDCIFNLAGSVAHTGIDAEDEENTDLILNQASHESFLKTLAKHVKSTGSKPKVVYAGTRDEYGRVPELHLPVREDYGILKTADQQGVHKWAAGHYHILASEAFGFPVSWLRLTNTYGPRQSASDPKRGFLPWFIKQALNDEELNIWSRRKGNILVSALRDLNYVDDVVDAFLMTMASEKSNGEIYNLGSALRVDGLVNYLCENVTRVGEVAERIVKLAGKGRVKYIEKETSAYMGNFCADIGKIYGDLKWKPTTSLEEGLKKTIGFYAEHKEY